MAASGSDERKGWQKQPEQSAYRETDHGRTGQGAASALAQLISEGEKQRRQNGELDDAAQEGHP